MFDLIRNHQRWVQFILLLLILPSFVFVGIQGYSSLMAGDRSSLAKVAGETISPQEFDNAVRSRMDQMRSMMGAQFNAQSFNTPIMRQAVLDELINTHLVAAEAGKYHFSATDQALQETIAAIPAVQENGRFSYDRYRDALAAQGMTPASFSAQLRRDMSMQQVLGPVAQSVLVPKAVMDRLITAATERRDVQVYSIPAANYDAKVSVSDDEIKSYYDAHRAAFNVPERVDAQYVLLDQSAIAPAVTVSDADIKSYYDQNQSRFRQEEQRRASHILIQVDAKASAADREAARKKAEALDAQAKAPGADFAKLARANSQDQGSAANGGDLDWFGRGMMVKPFEDAAFAMKEGEVSGVVATDYGFHIIKLTGVRPAAVKPLAEVRSQIVDEIKQQQAAQKFAEAAEQFTNTVYEQSDSLDPVASKFNLKVQEQDGVARTPARGANDVFSNPKVLEALYSDEVLRDKRNSGVIELGANRMVAVRVAKYVPASARPLADVSSAIRQQLVREKALELARKDGEAKLKALQAADSADGFGKMAVVARNAPAGLAPEVVGAAMKASTAKLPAFVGASTNDAYVIVRVSKVEGAPVLDPAVLANEKSILERRMGQAEQLAVLQTLRQEYKVKVSEAGTAAIEGQAPAE